MRTLWLWLVLAVLGMASPDGARAQVAPPIAAPGPVVPGSDIRVYLMTIGQGDLVWERFGHNAIWLQDGANGIDHAFNWGMFDFAQPNFLGRFLTGDTQYWMEGFDAAQMVAAYTQENRSVWIQELDLTPEQRVAMRDFLLWNARPENKFYRYDYYRDNCSTRVRDAIDSVLGGVLRRATEAKPTGTTYRSHTRRLTAGDAPVYTGIQLALGRPSDREITAWEESFLPVQLMEHVRDVKVAGPDGAMRPLVRSERQLFAAARSPERATAPDFLGWYLAAGVAIALVIALLARRAHVGAGALAFTVITAVWTLLAGVLGAALVLAGTVTRHAFMGRNLNLFVVNPLHLVLFALIVVVFLTRRPRSRTSRAGRASRVAVFVAALSLVGLVAMAVPSAGQHSMEIYALALPVNAALAWALLHLSRGQRTVVHVG